MGLIIYSVEFTATAGISTHFVLRWLYVYVAPLASLPPGNFAVRVSCVTPTGSCISVLLFFWFPVPFVSCVFFNLCVFTVVTSCT